MFGDSIATSIASNTWDVIVIGAGAAGLMASLELPSHLNVLLLNRNTSKRSSSRWAQGGIAAVIRQEDSLNSHAEDTFRAGAGICDGNAVRMFVEEAPQCVERLLELGMEFDRDSQGLLATTLEAAHSFRRVLYVKDRTGRALVEVLQDQVENRSNILHRRGVRVTKLLVDQNRCFGVQVLDGPSLKFISSRAVILATGGGGHLFANTTNPEQACGAGIALAWSAGAEIEDLEFFQFHPTALRVDGASCFLLSEALRGEGAVLIDSFGKSPVDHLPGKDLAPRDQVSRALFQTMQSQSVNSVFLDLRAIPKTDAEERFPTILGHCKELGLDPLNNLVPVAPAAHYWMGGVVTNLQSETTLSGLYAVGEVASTGLHGANRLASNSLMECLVFSRKMRSIHLNDSSELMQRVNQIKPLSCSKRLTSACSEKYLIKSIQELRSLCWEKAGVMRSENSIKEAISQIRIKLDLIMNEPLLKLVQNQDLEQIYQLDEIARKHLNLLLDLSHRQLASLLMLEAILFRRESRGGHFRVDYPKSQSFWRCHSRQRKGHDIFTRKVNL